MKKNRCCVILLFFVFGIVACKEKITPVSIATGGVTGTYYSFGMEMGKILGEKTKIPITIQSSGASKANIQLVSSGIVEFAIVQNDVMDYAWRGVDLFAAQQTDNFYVVGALYAEVCQIVANSASGIKTVADLRGKRVSVGNMASGTEFNARQILEVYGIDFDQINIEYFDFGDSAKALNENKIDAFFCVAGAPTPAIRDLAKEIEVIIIEIGGTQADELVKKYPFYTKYTIPLGSYDWQNKEIQTVAVKATLIVNSDIKENTVYRLTKALFESKAELEAAHNKGRELSVFYAVEGISVPFHPGAKKYYAETGALR